MVLHRFILCSFRRRFLSPYCCQGDNTIINNIREFVIIKDDCFPENIKKTLKIITTCSGRDYSTRAKKYIQSVILPYNLNSCSVRHFSSVNDFLSEYAASWTIWGWSGILLNSLHRDGIIPLWACMSLMNITVRTSLIPLVIKGAHTSSRFGSVAPEVGFLVTIFQNDLKNLKEKNTNMIEKVSLFQINWKSLRKIYKLHQINPLDILKSPLMQVPVFWYFSIDIRKILNGGDPELAQKLTESGFLWVKDLTIPDPFYGLPVISGLLLYINVEMAIGKKNLSGERASKSSVAIALKDFFQSLAIFMPCFMSNSPSGVQIYLATSFAFTLIQGLALRNDSCRKFFGLPSMDTKPLEPKIAKGFIELKKKEKKAKKKRGHDNIKGKGILVPGWEVSFTGKHRESTINIEGKERNMK